MATHYDVGDVAVVEGTFAVNDVPTDPATVSLKLRAPDGTVTTLVYDTDPELGRESAGVYFAELLLTQAGYWRYRWEGSEPAPGAVDGLLIADPDPFAAGYDEAVRRSLCTLEEAKEYAGEPLEDTQYDLLFRRLIDDCSEAFYRYTHREFTPIETSPVARTFDLTGWEQRERKLWIGDLASTTGLQVTIALQDGSALATVPAASIVALPRNREPWQPITQLWFPLGAALPALLPRNGVVTVSGDWGFPQVPSDVRQLACVQVAIWFERDVAKFSGTFSLAEGRTIRPRMLDDAVRDGLDFGYRVIEAG